MYVWMSKLTFPVFYSARVSPIQRVRTITQYVAIKVESRAAGILLREGIILLQWGDLNLR